MARETLNGLTFDPAESAVAEIFEKNDFVFDDTYQLEPVSGGLVHHVFRLVSSGKTMYLKIRGSAFSALPDIHVNPDDIRYEKKAMDLLNQKLPGVFPGVIAYFENDHALLMTDAMSGPTLEELFNTDEVSEDALRECGKAVARFHRAVETSPPIRPDNDNLSYLNNLFYRLGYLGIPALDRAIEHLKQLPRQLIFGDLSPKNIGIGPNNEITFCDLELVHFGNTVFDLSFLASHLLLHSRNVEEGASRLESFLAGYLEEAEVDLDEELLKVLILGIGLFRLDNPVIPYTLPISERCRGERILKIKEILSSDIKSWHEIIEGMTYA